MHGLVYVVDGAGGYKSINDCYKRWKFGKMCVYKI